MQIMEASGVGRRASGPEHPARRRASGMRMASGVAWSAVGAIGIEHRASSIEHRESRMEHRPSSVDPCRLTLRPKQWRRRAWGGGHQASSIKRRRRPWGQNNGGVGHGAGRLKHQAAASNSGQNNGGVQVGQRGAWGKKRGSNRSWSPMIGPKPNLVWSSAREEEMRRTRWTQAEGGGYDLDPVSPNAGPREEDTERRRGDNGNIGFYRLVHNG